MEEEVMQLKEISISANAENPAYEMIRQAQAKREFYEKQLKEYSCNVYIKGLQRITEAPKKILGVDITLPGVEKDSANSGIIYLSESVSEFSYQIPNKKKERMISSKTSGNNNGFSWNSALDFNLDFYQPSMELDGLSERNFISPIAPTAMVYYDYEFAGDFTDGNVLVNKIRVIPKRKGLPAYSGYIYIQENSWRIHSTELVHYQGISERGFCRYFEGEASLCTHFRRYLGNWHADFRFPILARPFQNKRRWLLSRHFL